MRALLARAIFVLNPSVGLRVESERLWATANANEICRLLFVNKMDHEQADAVERIEPLLSRLDAKGVHLQLPIGAGGEFKGVVDLPSMKAYLYEGSGGKFSETEIPADLQAAAEDMRRQLMDSVAEADDGFLEKYLDGGEFSLEELKQTIREATRQRKIFPILYGSATHLIGIPQLLEAVLDYLPAPGEEAELEGTNPITREVERRAHDLGAPFSAYVFKTLVDPFAGKLSVMRVISGKISSDETCLQRQQTEQRKNRSHVPAGGEKARGHQRSAGRRDRRSGEAQGCQQRRYALR